MFSSLQELDSLDNFDFIKEIGQGYSSKVLLYRDKQTEQLVAVKLFKLTTCSQFEKEKQLLPLLCFQGVITLKAFGTLLNENGRRAPFLLLDFFENGSLYNLIDKTGALDDETAHYFFCKIVTTIQKIHDSDIVHRDIALGNIMLDDDFNPVLIDFAFAAHYKNKKIKLSDLVGTLPYMAPEILDQCNYYPFQTEIFSLGVVLFQLLQGRAPFKEATRDDRNYLDILSSTQNDTDAIKLAKQMMSLYPSKRPTFEDLHTHHWVNKAIDEASIKQRLREIFNIQK